MSGDTPASSSLGPLGMVGGEHILSTRLLFLSESPCLSIKQTFFSALKDTLKELVLATQALCLTQAEYMERKYI